MSGTAKHAPAYSLATLFGLAKELGLTAGEAKEAAYSLIGKDSLKQFTQSEINQACFEFMARKDAGKRIPGRITERQLFKVREYERLLGWSGDPSRLAGLIRKNYHVTFIRWLTTAQASGLIDGLKAMYERGREETPDE